MNYPFSYKKHCYSAGMSGFSLIETTAALVILSFFTTGILVVINRCVSGTADMALRRHAFQLVRNKMEDLLSSSSVRTMEEYGFSEVYPEVEWKTTVETFYEPVGGRMWTRAICSAEYPDSSGEYQSVELIHWLSNITQSQLAMILQERQKLKDEARRLLIDTLDRAAEYAETDEGTILEWIDKGMQLTEEGLFIKGQLDLYLRTNGEPTSEEIRRQAEIDAVMGIKTEDNADFYDEYQSTEEDKSEQGEEDALSEEVDEQDNEAVMKPVAGEDVDFSKMNMKELMNFIDDSVKTKKQ